MKVLAVIGLFVLALGFLLVPLYLLLDRGWGVAYRVVVLVSLGYIGGLHRASGANGCSELVTAQPNSKSVRRKNSACTFR